MGVVLYRGGGKGVITNKVLINCTLLLAIILAVMDSTGLKVKTLAEACRLEVSI